MKDTVTIDRRVLELLCSDYPPDHIEMVAARQSAAQALLDAGINDAQSLTCNTCLVDKGE